MLETNGWPVHPSGTWDESMTISRRAILKWGTTGIGVAAASAVPTMADAPGSGELPNILWLVSEDNNPYIGAYGDWLAHTPNIDALARRGVLYRNAYSDAPVCAPSRFAILTGVNPESCAPAQHMRADAKLPDGFSTYPELMRQAGYYTINNPKTDYNCGVDPKKIWDVQGIEGHWRNAPKDKPFLCVLNTGTSHEQHMCQREEGRVKPADVRIPAFLPDNEVFRRDYAEYYNIMEAMDREIGNWLSQLENDGLADNTIVFYYGDNGGVLPRSKRYCYEEGLRVPLIAYIPPKWQHLAPGKPGSVIDAPVTLIDLPTTLLSIAGVAQPAQMTGKPLFGRRMGKPARYAFGFRDRMDERYDLVRTVTDGRWRYIRNYMPHRALGQHVGFEWEVQASYREWQALHLAGKLTAQQDAFFRPKPFEELYDLHADPDEVANLIDDPRAKAAAGRLRKALDAHMLAINDNGFLPEGAPGEGYFESRDRSIYPLKSLMVLAAAAGKRNPRNANRFAQLLASPVLAVRFWAARGLLMLGKKAQPAKARLERVLANDPSNEVRIAAAETLVALGEQDEAVATLARLIGEGNSWQIKTQALDALSNIGEAALPALPAIRNVANAQLRRFIDVDYPKRMARYLVAQLEGSYNAATEGISAQACAASDKSGANFMGPPANAYWTN